MLTQMPAATPTPDKCLSSCMNTQNKDNMWKPGSAGNTLTPDRNN